MGDANDMACREFVELVTEYLENALPRAAMYQCKDHLAACTGCRAYMRQMWHTVVMLGSLIAERIPAGAREELLMQFRSRHLATSE
jgi:predicted anti-sigma-YlaC factor YlaD